MPAGNYLSGSGDTGNILLTPFKLKAGDEWSHTVNFFADYSKEEQRRYKAFEKALRENIAARLVGMDPNGPAIAGDEASVAPVLEFFNQKFKWLLGEYSVELSVQTVPTGAASVKRMRTTVFEWDSQDMKDFQEQFKFGKGLWWGEEPGVVLDLTDNT